MGHKQSKAKKGVEADEPALHETVDEEEVSGSESEDEDEDEDTESEDEDEDEQDESEDEKKDKATESGDVKKEKLAESEDVKKEKPIESEDEKKDEEQFHQLAGEIINAALALKDHFTEPIDESAIKEYDALHSKLYMMDFLAGKLYRKNYDFCADDQGPTIMFIGYLFEMNSLSIRCDYEPDPNLAQLGDIVDKIKSEKRILEHQRQRERESHLYDEFEAVYNNNNKRRPKQKELDEAYFSFAKKVYNYLCDITAEYRPGSYSEMNTWFSEEAGIEAEFKKRFPKYKPPCNLNQAGRK